MSTSVCILQQNAALSETRARLRELLAADLSFCGQDTATQTHDFHAFPAKFPPQLPRLFIDALTTPGATVLDPMSGSGTCAVEAMAAGRRALAFDIDPLAVLLGRVKTTPADAAQVIALGLEVIERAEFALAHETAALDATLATRWDAKTTQFVNYWFSPTTQRELLALLQALEAVREPVARDFLRLVFSAIIITKTGGVSLAWDLAHTRPHKLRQGAAKSYRPALPAFRRRLLKNVANLLTLNDLTGTAQVAAGNAESLPLASESVDLYFTSPPYAANAIDYMRANKFSLVWFGQTLNDLAAVRGACIGGEQTKNFRWAELPPATARIVAQITATDARRGAALRRYYSEMTRVIAEAHRVLKRHCAAVFVVGSAMMRGLDTQAAACLAEVGAACGFEVAGIATRNLDRDRRLMPARKYVAPQSIEARMHQEYIVAMVKA